MSAKREPERRAHASVMPTGNECVLDYHPLVESLFLLKQLSRAERATALRTSMMARSTAILLMLILAHIALAQKQSERTMTRHALVEMEHAFAKAAATKGTRDAFLEFLADDGIVFQPGPVNGKKFWTERQPARGL